jgi:hypothetical protein
MATDKTSPDRLRDLAQLAGRLLVDVESTERIRNMATPSQSIKQGISTVISRCGSDLTTVDKHMVESESYKSDETAFEDDGSFEEVSLPHTFIRTDATRSTMAPGSSHCETPEVSRKRQRPSNPSRSHSQEQHEPGRTHQALEDAFKFIAEAREAMLQWADSMEEAARRMRSFAQETCGSNLKSDVH